MNLSELGAKLLKLYEDYHDFACKKRIPVLNRCFRQISLNRTLGAHEFLPNMLDGICREREALAKDSGLPDLENGIFLVFQRADWQTPEREVIAALSSIAEEVPSSLRLIVKGIVAEVTAIIEDAAKGVAPIVKEVLSSEDDFKDAIMDLDAGDVLDGCEGLYAGKRRLVMSNLLDGHLELLRKEMISKYDSRLKRNPTFMGYLVGARCGMREFLKGLESEGRLYAVPELSGWLFDRAGGVYSQCIRYVLSTLNK
jgi:hypothetical protein